MKTLLLSAFLLLLAHHSIGIEVNFSPNRNITTCGPTTVYFVYNKTVEPDLIYWDFGDGTTSNKINPEHYYKKEGVYDVKLVIIKNNIKDSLVKRGMITIKPNPSADFNKKMISQTNPGKGVDFLFTNTSAHFATSFQKVRWVISQVQDTFWGDTLKYTFKRDGEYNVALMVENNAGCRDEKTVQVSINNSGVEQPVGITEAISENGMVKVYPNPANNQLYLYTPSYESQLTLVNTLGVIQKIPAIPLPDGTLSLDVSLVPDGMYWICVTTHEQLQYKPLIISH
jgi:PKD repeat protein